MSKPDLAAALKDIRAQYENLSARNQVQAEEWYRSKFATVTETAARNQDAIKHSKEELSEYRRQVQARTLEIEALRSHNEAMERQIAEMEDRHNNEIGEMQVGERHLKVKLNLFGRCYATHCSFCRNKINLMEYVIVMLLVFCYWIV